MNAHELKNRVKNLTIWKNGDQRAPHKPLLMLYALSQLKHSRTRFIPYVEVREKVGLLLKEFGPARKSYHPEHPFVRLKNDGLWELNHEIQNNQFTNKMLLEHKFAGGFTKDVYQLLRADYSLVDEVVQMILESHFPETFHTDILDALDLELFTATKKRVRDKAFREKVLKAYEYSCAVCNFNLHLSHQLVGVEAAHIKWHHAGGPDREENGIALCSLHHKLFDRGVFTISEKRKLIVSEFAHGNEGYRQWVLKYHDKEIREPINPNYFANQRYLEWHFREVFRSPGRIIAV
ncbi:phosphorothioated DNA-binding restriction endonuclease [Fictibacillus fluitans]|uniref:HNH endonuclease n=1 Tax=Fictibacillus fluitans TaxID=3058422 RepID=A0ABT8HYV0_9BACL|nr:HNH endonuclease [Fictibacillus sp. NE201]MDN4525952.1 HNH endonuclease [Fictibacillus sp. NE201]